MKPAILLLFLLVLPLAFAFDCNDFSNKEWCTEIQNSNLSVTEKEYLLSGILTENRLSPDFELVKQWNVKVVPEGINKGTIHNAWNKIYYLLPSVLYNNTYLIPNKGELGVGYNYETVLPTTTVSGDCKTYYSIQENSGVSKTYLQNNLISTSHFAKYDSTFIHNQKVEFKSVYEIKVVTKIEHYRWKKSCKFCRYSCKFDNTQYQTDQLVLEDKWSAQIHNPTLKANFTIVDQYWNTTKVKIDAVNFNLEFNDASLNQSRYTFILVLNDGMLSWKAELQQNMVTHNLVLSEGYIYVNNPHTCKITVIDFFKQTEFNCDLSYTKPEIKLSTDKTTYASGEEIKLSISPLGDYVVNYAGKNYTTTVLRAEYPYNKISVNGEEVFIHVQNNKPLSVVFTLAIFGTFNYAIIGVVKRYF